MSGGGGGTFRSRSPEDLIRLVRKAEDETSVAEFEASLSGMLGELLGVVNSRDVELVQQRLDEAKAAISDLAQGALDQIFGGSVAKHTYVDGLSDVDSLLILNDTELAEASPHDIIALLRDQLAASLKGIQISSGRMAVTLTYSDGLILQLLPAIRDRDGRLRVPSSRHEGWSRIDPEAFSSALTKQNKEQAGKLVPTIKLAKAVLGELPQQQRLSGYHVESLAIQAFRGYDGPKTTASMLPTFFERARDLVLKPIVDSTGQSVHVDEYLGVENSVARVVASHVLGRIAKRMRTATASGSKAQWRALFGLDE